MPLINKIAFAAWGLVVACVAVWALDRYEPDFSAEYLAVASQGRANVRLIDVSCISIDRKRVIYDQKEYADPNLAEAITNLLSIKDVFYDADARTCQWYLDADVISGRNYNVTYGGKFTRYTVSIAICERPSEGRMYECFDKEIYVLNRNVEPHKLFLLALAGLARPQAEEWEVFEVKKDAL